MTETHLAYLLAAAVAAIALACFVAHRLIFTRLTVPLSRLDKRIRKLQHLLDDPDHATGEGRTLVDGLTRLERRLDRLEKQLRNGAAPGKAGRTKTAKAEAEKAFDGLLAHSRIRPIRLHQLFPGIERQQMEIGAIDPDTSQPNHVDMLYVCAIARHTAARRIFEFGTYLGRTTHHLALGPDAERVYTLDLDRDEAAARHEELDLGKGARAVHERRLQGVFFREEATRERIVQLHGDSLGFDYRDLHVTMDLVFVDGGHGRTVVGNDTEQAFRLIRPGGVILWHDFAPKTPGVPETLAELSVRTPLFWIEHTALAVYVDGIDAASYDAPPAPYARRALKGRSGAGEDRPPRPGSPATAGG